MPRLLSPTPRIGVRPDFAKLSGTFHIAPVDDIAAAIAAAATASQQEPEDRTIRIVNYPGTGSIRTEVMAAYAEELFQKPENKSLQELPTTTALHWVGMAKRAGLFEWFFTSQELIVTDSQGQRAVSKR